jgi:hypothetical protein
MIIPVPMGIGMDISRPWVTPMRMVRYRNPALPINRWRRRPIDSDRAIFIIMGPWGGDDVTQDNGRTDPDSHTLPKLIGRSRGNGDEGYYQTEGQP